VVFLAGPPLWEAMFGGGGWDARPNKEDEMCGRRDRAQNEVVLRNVWGGKRGAEAWLTQVPFSFCFFLNQMHLFKVQRQHSALTLWPTKTIPSSPQETSKSPSPSGMSPTAHLAYGPTKSYEHTRISEGSRKERSKQEREENP